MMATHSKPQFATELKPTFVSGQPQAREDRVRLSQELFYFIALRPLASLASRACTRGGKGRPLLIFDARNSRDTAELMISRTTNAAASPTEYHPRRVCGSESILLHSGVWSVNSHRAPPLVYRASL